MPRIPLSNIPIFHEKLQRKNVFDLGEMKRYYSSIDTDIYFGEFYIEEIVALQFQVQQNAMPLFGYNSYVFDDLALGNRMISGMFAINFTSPSYLFAVLKELSSLNTAPQGNFELIRWGYTNGIEVYWNSKENKTVVGGTSFSPGEIPGTTFKDDRHYVQNEEELLDAIGLGGAAKHRRNWSNKPLWNQGFDIDIVYGKKQETPLRASVKGDTMDFVIKDVQIVSCAQELSISGDPIIENYSFIARDILPL